MAANPEPAFLSKNEPLSARVFENLVSKREQNARELSEALQQKTAISEILRAISNSPTNVQPILDTVAENAARLCNVTNAEILQVEGDELRLVAKHGQHQIWPMGFKVPISRNYVVGRAVADRTSVHVHDLQAAETDFPRGALYAKQYGHRTTFATPLMREGVAIGAILIRRLEVRPLTDNQIELLKTFADQAAIAIENVRLFNETQEALAHQTASADILRVISRSPTDLRPVFDAIVTTSVKRLGCDIAIVQSCNGGTYSPQAMATPAGLTPVLGPQVMPVDPDANFPSRAIVSKTMLHVRDWSAIELPPHEQVRHEQLGLNSALYLPLLRGDACLGLLVLGNKRANAFNDKAIALAESFRDQALIAIENARLFNEIQEKNRQVKEQAKELAEWNAALETRVAEQVTQLERFSKLEHELSLAGEIQKSMLPRSIPRLEGFEFSAAMIPAKSVGGDFFDFIPLGEDLLGIAVGDVSDKGIPAALFMAMVRSLLRAEAHPGRPPKRVLRSVNRHLMDMNDKEMFVTILFGILNRVTHQFHYARAGHEAPIFFDEQGSIKRMPKTNGQALGVFDEIALDEQTVELSKGSMLLLYSDGIPETPNRQNVSFGHDGLVRTVGQMQGSSAQKVCDELIKAAVKHQEGSLQHDDMTVVVVRAV
jgi:serine phosphatase RsbU (regulator of sigma subunit)